jgi:hypothetical protein
MAKLQQHALLNDFLIATQDLKQLRTQYGPESSTYRNGLQRVGRLWSVLRMTRHTDEFLQDMTLMNSIVN